MTRRLVVILVLSLVACSESEDEPRAAGGAAGAVGGGAAAGASGTGGSPGSPSGSHRALLERRSGFAREVTGAGLDADDSAPSQVWVTTTADSGTGSLRDALATPNRWVRFAPELGESFTITLESPLRAAANITLDGRGAHPILATNHRHSVFDVREDNQIYVNLDIIAGGENQDDQADCFNINGGADAPADNIWIHHVSMTGVRDKRVGVSFGGRVTIDWCDLYGNTGHGILVGCAVCTRPDVSFVTVHHNFLHGLPDRYPRVSFGHHVHAFNNVCEAWDYYAMGSVDQGQLLAESNWFMPASDPTAIKASEGGREKGFVKAVSNVLNGGSEEANGPEQVFVPEYNYALEPANDIVVTVRGQAGWQPGSFWQSP